MKNMVKAMRFSQYKCFFFLVIYVFDFSFLSGFHGMGFLLSHVKCVSEPVDLKSRPYSDKNCKITPFDHPKPS